MKKFKEFYHKYDYKINANFILETIIQTILIFAFMICLFLFSHRDVNAATLYPANTTFYLSTTEDAASYSWSGIMSSTKDYKGISYFMGYRGLSGISAYNKAAFTFNSSVKATLIGKKFTINVITIGSTVSTAYTYGDGNLTNSCSVGNSNIVAASVYSTVIVCDYIKSNANYDLIVGIQSNGAVVENIGVGISNISYDLTDFELYEMLINSIESSNNEISNSIDEQTKQQHQDAQDIKNSIEGDNLDTGSIESSKNDSIDAYKNAESSLNLDGADLSGIDLGLNATASSQIWYVLQQHLNVNSKLMGFILAMLSIGLIKLFLGR